MFCLPIFLFLLTENFPEARHNLIPIYAYSPTKLDPAATLQVLTESAIQD